MILEGIKKVYKQADGTLNCWISYSEELTDREKQYGSFGRVCKEEWIRPELVKDITEKDKGRSFEFSYTRGYGGKAYIDGLYFTDAPVPPTKTENSK